MSGPYLSPEEARAFYDRFGRAQDWQSFYEGPAIRALLAHGDFESSRHVFELGCGTGALARTLLGDHLPPEASYDGVDLSATMVELARTRLAPFEGRARIHYTAGDLHFPCEPGSFDRFVATYVFDLLSPDALRDALDEAHGLLRPGGLLCTAGLHPGRRTLDRLLMGAWDRIRRWDPALVGGCRPLSLVDRLDPKRWRVVHHDVVSAFGIPSEVLVAAARG